MSSIIFVFGVIVIIGVAILAIFFGIKLIKQ
jgi:hypothetical protein